MKNLDSDKPIPNGPANLLSREPKINKQVAAGSMIVCRAHGDGFEFDEVYEVIGSNNRQYILRPIAADKPPRKIAFNYVHERFRAIPGKVRFAAEMQRERELHPQPGRWMNGGSGAPASQPVTARERVTEQFMRKWAGRNIWAN